MWTPLSKWEIQTKNNKDIDCDQPAPPPTIERVQVRNFGIRFHFFIELFDFKQRPLKCLNLKNDIIIEYVLFWYNCEASCGEHLSTDSDMEKGRDEEEEHETWILSWGEQERAGVCVVWGRGAVICLTHSRLVQNKSNITELSSALRYSESLKSSVGCSSCVECSAGDRVTWCMSLSLMMSH